MCRRYYIFMIGVLDGVDALTLEHTIWLYLHPISHCRAQRFAGCASVQVMKAVLFPDALSCKVQIVNEIGLGFQQNLLKVDTNIVLYQVLFCSNSRKSYLLIFVLFFNYRDVF